ncbi:hypothetical protein HLB23_05050 [Nocardia uniformis]|uniref:Uncharacterized protein n=1 Tax=Nocardia uniformis TaxID=53432 RepID=A0A849BRD8_9NOCA|nr:hypothetical protein [Nocardia uniformis]NNH69242.1 hypothetical protein [Nocardia uniformis]
MPKHAPGGPDFDAAFPGVATQHNMLAGFKTYGGAPQGVARLSLRIVVMRFLDAETAVRAADELAEVATTTTGISDDDVYQAAPLADEPEVRYSITKREKSVGVRAFAPYHEYVIYTGVDAVTEVDAERTTKRAIELQRPLLDSFVATEPAKYAELPIDPEGVYGLALGTGYRRAREGTYGPRAASLMMYDQPRMLALFGDVGMTAAGVAGTTVYRTRDNAAAQQLAMVLSEFVVRHHNYDAQLLAPAATPPDSPNTQCWSTLAGIRSWYCLVTEGRYVGEIWEGSKTEAHDLAIQQARALLTAR